MIPRLFFKALLPAVLVGLLVSSCGETGSATKNAVAATLPIPLPGKDLQLPVSLGEVMVALVNYAADPIRVAAWKSPQTEGEWRDLERLASQLEVAGALLTIPGTGPMDREWTANPQWQASAVQLRDAGGRALDAVRRRDKVAIAAAGDDIAKVCEGCHSVFKPAAQFPPVPES
jgi:hypothetical protein